MFDNISTTVFKEIKHKSMQQYSQEKKNIDFNGITSIMFKNAFKLIGNC